MPTDGPGPRVERDGPAGRGDPTSNMTRISRVDRNLAGRVRSGQEVFKVSRDRFGRLTRFSNIAGRVRSGRSRWVRRLLNLTGGVW